MHLLQLLPLEDLASRRSYKKALPRYTIYPLADFIALEHKIASLFNDMPSPFELTIDLAEAQDLPIEKVKDLHEWCRVYSEVGGRRVISLRVVFTQDLLRVALEENLSLEEFSEVAVELAPELSDLLPLVEGSPLGERIVVLVDGTTLTAPVEVFLEAAGGYGLKRLEVEGLSSVAMEDFKKKCFPLYGLPDDAGWVALWQRQVVIVPATPALELVTPKKALEGAAIEVD